MIEHHLIHMHIYNSMCSCSVWYTCKVLVYTSPVECSHVITACKWWAAANGSGKPVYHWRHYFGWWWRCSSHRFWIWCTSQMGITMYTSHVHIAFASLCSGRWLAFASFCSGLWFCPTEGYCLYRLLKDMPMLQHHLQNQLLVAAIFFDFCKNILRCNWRLFSSTLENQTQWTMQHILLSLRNHWKLPRLEKTNHGVWIEILNTNMFGWNIPGMYLCVCLFVAQ